MPPNTSDFGPEFTGRTQAASAGWINTYTTRPTTLASPTTVETRAAMDSYIVNRPGWNGTPGGNIYDFLGDGSNQLIIYLPGVSPTADPLFYPIRARNYLDIMVIAPKIRPVLPDDGDIGEQPNLGSNPGVNVQPRLNNGGILLHLDAINDVWIEGVDANMVVTSPNAGNVDVGMEGDFTVHRATFGTPQSPQSPTQVWTTINSRFFGNEGSSLGIHGDMFQNQGASTAIRFQDQMRYENVWYSGGQSGIVVHANQSQRLSDLTFRRYISIVTDDYATPGQENLQRGLHMDGGWALKNEPNFIDVQYRRDNEANGTFCRFRDPADNWNSWKRYRADNAPATDEIHPGLTWLDTQTPNDDYNCTESQTGYNYVDPIGTPI